MEKNNKKKILGLPIGLAVMIVVSAIGLAAWALLTQSSYEATVLSTNNNPLMFSVNIPSVELDTRNGPDNDTATGTLVNNDGEMSALVSITQSFANQKISCTPATTELGDCSANYYLGWESISNGSTVAVPQGLNDVKVSYTCPRYSCPGVIAGNISFSVI